MPTSDNEPRTSCNRTFYVLRVDAKSARGLGWSGGWVRGGVGPRVGWVVISGWRGPAGWVVSGVRVRGLHDMM